MPLVVVATEDAGGQWLTSESLAGCAPEGVDVDLVADAAADLMFALSGYQFGSATETVRPFGAIETCGHAAAVGDAYSFAWTSHSAWSRVAACGCAGPSYLRLVGPVSAVGSVTIDGEALEPDAYVLYDGQWLVRVEGVWPCCQDLTKPSTEDGTWAISYTHGVPVPAAGQIAAQVLGCELAKAAAGSRDCALMGRVQSVTRDGVSAVVVDSQDFLQRGHTGIAVVDLWLASLGNLHGGTLTMPGSPLRGLLVPTPLAP